MYLGLDPRRQLYHNLHRARLVVTAMAPKRKPEATGEEPAAKKAAGGGLVNPKRVNVLKEGTVGKGPVIYW